MLKKNGFTLKTLAALSLGLGLSLSVQAAELIVTTEIPVSTNPTPTIEKFLSLVEERTNGEIKGKLFPASQLYNDRDALAALGTGGVHMVWPVASRLELFDENMGIISLPFTVTEQQMTNSCFAPVFVEKMSSFIEPKGMKLLGLARTADMQFVMRDKDIQTAEDLKNQKIRVVGGKVILDAMEQAGVSPVSMAASEMSSALSQGAIEGALTSPAGWHDLLGSTAKFTTVVPGLSLATSAVVVDNDWFKSLSVKNQEIIQNTVDELLRQQWIDTIAKDKALNDAMVAKGGKFTVMSEDQTAIIRDKFAKATDGYKSKHPEIVKFFEELDARCK